MTRKKLLRYLLAVGLSGATYVAKLKLFSAFQVDSPLMILSMVISAWWGGLGPGIVAVILTAALELYSFVPPSTSFAIETVRDGVQFSVFLFVSVLISTLVSFLH